MFVFDVWMAILLRCLSLWGFEDKLKKYHWSSSPLPRVRSSWLSYPISCPSRAIGDCSTTVVSDEELDGASAIQKTKMTEMTRRAMMPHKISLFLNLAFLINVTRRLDLVRSPCIPYRFLRVLFSSLSDWERKLYLMSRAISSHSRPTALASSNLFRLWSRTRSCFDPSSMSSPVS